MQILDQERLCVRRAESQVYVATVCGHLTRRVVADALAAIWADPRWEQPWGLVVSADPDVTYSLELRLHEVPTTDRRAVGTAVATLNTLHRMVVNSIGVGLRIASRFDLSAHPSEGDAITRMIQQVRKAQLAGRRY